ncbi:MAG: hypothetical protein ACFB21_07795 [Opitutales bacterium]
MKRTPHFFRMPFWLAMTTGARLAVFVFGALFSCAGAGAIEGEEAATRASSITPEERAAARRLEGKPHYLFLETGNRLTGEVLSYTEERLTFRQGNAEFSFPRERIASLSLPGGKLLREARELARKGRPEEGVPLATAVWRHRVPYLDLLPPEDLFALIQVIELNLYHGDPYLAFGAARKLRTLVDDPSVTQRLEALELLGAYHLPIKTQAWALAEAGVAESPRYGPSALPFFVLAMLQLEDETPEAALETALRPVIFSSQLPMAYLGECYAVAITAAVELEEPETARALAEEMQARSFAWPGQAILIPGKPTYETASSLTSQP